MSEHELEYSRSTGKPVSGPNNGTTYIYFNGAAAVRNDFETEEHDYLVGKISRAFGSTGWE